MKLSDETRDGLFLEMQLASNPKIVARGRAFWALVNAFRKKTAHKSKEEMITELKEDNPGYILDLLNSNSEAEIRSRYVMTFMHKEPKP